MSNVVFFCEYVVDRWDNGPDCTYERIVTILRNNYGYTRVETRNTCTGLEELGTFDAHMGRKDFMKMISRLEQDEAYCLSREEEEE